MSLKDTPFRDLIKVYIVRTCYYPNLRKVDIAPRNIPKENKPEENIPKENILEEKNKPKRKYTKRK